MSNSIDFIKLAVENVLGPVFCIGAKSTRLELVDADRADHALVIEAFPVPDEESVRALVTDKSPGAAPEPKSVIGNHLLDLTKVICFQLPPWLLSGIRVKAQFTGVQKDDHPMDSASGDSLHGAIIPSTQGGLSTDPTVGAVISAAVKAAVDFVTSGEDSEARIGIDGMHGINSITWVLLWAQNGVLHARTNDIDLMVPQDPAFHRSTDTPAEMEAAITEYLDGVYQTAKRVLVRVLRDRSPFSPLQGDSQTGVLAPLPDVTA